MVIVYSATKGLAAMTMALAHSRGWLDFERPVAAYWPGFATNGKDKITVRQLLAHQAGLFTLDEPAWLGPNGPEPYWRGRISTIEYEFWKERDALGE